MIHRVLVWLVAVGAMAYVLAQVRKPGRLLGKKIARAMNQTHSALTDWGLSHVLIGQHSTILDAGCGGGATIRKLALIASEGVIYGIDYAPGSIAMASEVNADLIAAGRVKLEQTSVSHLPFPDNMFELVTAIETQYYWPDLLADMREVRRVLKPGAALLVVAESYKGGRNDWWQRPIMMLLGSSHLDVSAHRELFRAAGYDRAEIFEHPKGWICATGRKPATSIG